MEVNYPGSIGLYSTVKTAHETTSIKQSLVLIGHPFLVLSFKNFI